MRRVAIAVVWIALCAAAAGPAVVIPAGTRIPLATRADLSSKKSAKGDVVDLYLPTDLSVGGVIVVPAGTPAVGEIAESRETGGLGSNGKLAIAPLYIRIGDTVIRLEGYRDAKGKTKADTVLGLALVTAVISGRTAVLKANTPVEAMTVREVTITPDAR